MKHPLMTDDELHAALTQVRDMFVHQLIEYAPLMQWDDTMFGRGFDINAMCAHGECGTVACIGGWAWLLVKAKPVPGKPYVYDIEDTRRASEFVRMVDHPHPSFETDPKLRELFYPPTSKWNWIRPEHAVQAIDNYLAHGEPRWKEIEDAHYDHRSAA